MLDRSLWRNVDLRPYSFDLRNLGKLIRNLLSDALTSFHLSGHMHEGKDSLESEILMLLWDRLVPLPPLKSFTGY